MSKRNLYLLCITVLPFMICTGIIYSILSLYMASLGLTKSEIGSLFTAGAVAAAITSPLWGSLSDRFGRKKVLIFSMAIFAFVFLGYAFSVNYIHLMLVQLGEGIAWAAMGSAAVALVADMVPEENRGKAMGIYNMTWNTGWIIGPSLGGVISDHIGFMPTFLMCTGLTAAGVFMAVFLIPGKLPPLSAGEEKI
jgi:predicted MFS family arabinose efflux permease